VKGLINGYLGSRKMQSGIQRQPFPVAMMCREIYERFSLVYQLLNRAGARDNHAAIELFASNPYALDDFDEKIGKIAKDLFGERVNLAFRVLGKGVTQISPNNIVPVSDHIAVEHVEDGGDAIKRRE
jgi:hypothetical protein